MSFALNLDKLAAVLHGYKLYRIRMGNEGYYVSGRLEYLTSGLFDCAYASRSGRFGSYAR